MGTNKKVTELALDLFGIPAELAGSFRIIHRKFDQWILKEGNQGIKRSKEVFNYTLSYLLGESVTPPEWLSMSKTVEGSPKILEAVWHWILQNPRLGLTMIRYSDLFVADLTDENCLNALSPIIGDSTATSDKYENTVLDIASRYATDLSISDESAPMFTKGPNGISILSLHRDAIALNRDGISDSLRDLRSATERVAVTFKPSHAGEPEGGLYDSFLMRFFEENSPFGENYDYSKLQSGRVIFLPEKSGKIRVIAQGDYLSQLTLRPIHEALMGILKKIPGDWTFDQNGGKDWVQKKTATAKWCASFDLSNATDRLPLHLQAKIIDRVLPGNLGSLWARVLVDRPFTYTLPSGKEGIVRYKVGQPMGFFSSFASFALLHHFVVNAAFELAHGRPGKNFYAIIGDDMVIFDQAAGEIYLDIINSIGGVINLKKSRLSTKGNIIAEFAKAYFRNGVILTPFSLRELRSALNNWANVPKLYNRLRESLGIVIRTRKLNKIIQEYWPNETNILVQLLEVPEILGGFGKPGHTPLVKVLRGKSNTFRRYLAYRAFEAYKTVIHISADDVSMALNDVNDRIMVTVALNPFLTLLRDRNSSMGLSHMVTSRRSFLEWAMNEGTSMSNLVDCVTLMVKELPTSLREKVRRPSVMWVRALADDKKASESAIDNDQSVFYAFDYLAATG